MAANSQQGTFLGTTLVGFTALTAGLVMQESMGMIIAIVGLVLLIVSAAGLYRIKGLDS